MTIKSLKHDLGPSYLNVIFQNLSQIHCRDLRNTETDLRVPRKISCHGQKPFSFRGPKLWNQLNNEQKCPFSNSPKKVTWAILVLIILSILILIIYFLLVTCSKQRKLSGYFVLNRANCKTVFR